MQYEIRSFNGAQAGKVLGLINFFIGLILAIILGVGVLFELAGDDGPGLGVIAAMPFLYAIAGYVGARIFVAFYNRVAGQRGGIYLELGELYDPMDPPWKP